MVTAEASACLFGGGGGSGIGPTRLSLKVKPEKKENAHQNHGRLRPFCREELVERVASVWMTEHPRL